MSPLLPLFLTGTLNAVYGSDKDDIRGGNQSVYYSGEHYECQNTTRHFLEEVHLGKNVSENKQPCPPQETLRSIMKRFNIKKEPTVMGASRGLFNWVGNVKRKGLRIAGDAIADVKKVLAWTTKTTIKVGKRLIEVPVRGLEKTVNAAKVVKILGLGKLNKIISDASDMVHEKWEAVKAFEFPGKNLLFMFYPRGLVFIADKVTGSVVYMLDKTGKALTQALSYSLYVSVKYVFKIVDTVISLNRLNCAHVIPKKIDVNRGLVQSIEMREAELCGVSHLKALNNVTITNNDSKFLIVRVPCSLDEISLTLSGVNVSSGLGGVITNATMKIQIKHIKATASVEFESGTILKFIRIHIVVDVMDGIDVRFLDKTESLLMETIEKMADEFTPSITKEVNHELEKVGDKVFDYIANL